MVSAGMTGLGIVLFGVIVAGFLTLFFRWAFQNDRQKRELEHAERLKAIEFGTTLPQDRGMNPGVAIAIWVPLGVFGLALIGSSTSSYAAAFVWPSAAVVGATAIISGVVLAVSQPAAATVSVRNAVGPAPIKPHVVDPDTFDIADRRG